MQLIQDISKSDVHYCFWGIQLVNEPSIPKGIPVDTLKEFYLDMYALIRKKYPDVSKHIKG